MNLQKRLAAQIMKCGLNRVRIGPEKFEEAEQAITKKDVALLVEQGVIYKLQEKGVSRVRAKKRHTQRRRGRRRGEGSAKGTLKVGVKIKREWMRKIRAQRQLLKTLKGKGHIDRKSFAQLYMKAKGGFFRSKRHVLLYAKDNSMLKKIDEK